VVLLPIFLDAPGVWVVAVVPNRLLVVLPVVLLLLLGILLLRGILHLWGILHLRGILHLLETLQEILLLWGLFCWVDRPVEVE